MKKRIISSVLVLAIMAAFMLSALAAAGFDRSVMKNGADIYTSENEMQGMASYTIKSMMDNKDCIYCGGDLIFYPIVFSHDNADYYAFAFSCESPSYFDIDYIVFKIGNRRYKFSHLDAELKFSNGRCTATESLQMDSYSISMLDYIVQHRDEEIKVMVDGSSKDVTIVLDKQMKDWIVHLYNLYVQAGGLRSENLQALPKGLYGYGATLKIYDD